MPLVPPLQLLGLVRKAKSSQSDQGRPDDQCVEHHPAVDRVLCCVPTAIQLPLPVAVPAVGSDGDLGCS
ncbi:MAG TPA: hypothetical protein DDX19_27225 [Rhodopirellula baltica]|uniref:Uncharacterized protein n=2 Tax=Rhodopirellula baltica TaxID=265606 RepID=F2B177_RHOBT|nr:hypothetical protein RBWH47_00065 [Rhodopirellula baltica WH47]ELP35615.1 hypothetical protein RBSWK_00519 [Rhodopirellula baltica SWK14]HBE66379.1 hypothetical protein [Rhodopirellula baltica]